MSETVWIVTSPRTRKIYHTNEDCSRLIDSQRSIDLANLTEDWRECAHCDGTAASGGAKNEIYNTVLNL